MDSTTTLSTISGTLAVGSGGTGSTTLTGILKGNGTGGVQTAVAGTDYAAVSSIFGKAWEVSGNFLQPTTTTYVTNIQQASSTVFSALQGKFGATASTTIDTAGNVAVAGTVDVTGKTTLASASTTNISATYASSTSGFFGSLSVGSLSGFLKATAGVLATALVDLASNVTGILGVANGGTGWSNVASGAVVLGNGTGPVATTSAGTNGQVLALVSGTPTWVATSTLSSISGTLSVASGGTGQTTFSSSQLLYGNGTSGLSSVATSSASCSSGVSCSGFTVVGSVAPSITNTGLLSLQQLGGGSAQTGAVTFATSSVTLNGITHGLTITNSSGAFTFTPTAAGTLSVAGGGTNISSYTSGDILYASSASALSRIASSTDGFVLSLANGIPSWVATTTLTTIGGTLAETKGGTNQTTYTTGDILYASNTNTLSKLSASGNAGKVLSLSGGIPAWVSTTTLSTISGTLSGTQLDGVFSSNGILARTTTGTYASRTITGTSNQINVANGDGVSGNPTLSLPSQLTFTQSSSTQQSITNRLYVGDTATTTILGSATSTFGAGIQTTALNVTSASATSTFANGLNLSAGCFSIGGVCLATSGGVSLSVANVWSALQQFSAGASTTQLSAYSGLYVGDTATTTILGTATSTFGAGISASYLNLTGSSASSTASNGFNLSGGCFAINGVCQERMHPSPSPKSSLHHQSAPTPHSPCRRIRHISWWRHGERVAVAVAGGTSGGNGTTGGTSCFGTSNAATDCSQTTSLKATGGLLGNAGSVGGNGGTGSGGDVNLTGSGGQSFLLLP